MFLLCLFWFGSTGAPGTYGTMVNTKNGDKPVTLKEPPKVQPTSPNSQTKKAAWCSNKSKTLPDSLSSLPPWQSQSLDNSTDSQQNCALNPSAPPEDSSTGSEIAGDSGHTQNNFNWPASPPPSPTGHQGFAEWASEEEFATPAIPKLEHKATVRTGMGQSLEESHTYSNTDGWVPYKQAQGRKQLLLNSWSFCHTVDMHVWHIIIVKMKKDKVCPSYVLS